MSSLKSQIVDFLIANKTSLQSETDEITRDLKKNLEKEHKDFHGLIREEYDRKVRGLVIRYISMNMDPSVDYETSFMALEDVKMEDFLK